MVLEWNAKRAVSGPGENNPRAQPLLILFALVAGRRLHVRGCRLILWKAEAEDWSESKADEHKHGITVTGSGGNGRLPPPPGNIV